MKQLLLLSVLLLCMLTARTENGYRLWMRYERVKDASAAAFFRSIRFPAPTATLQAAKAELEEGCNKC